MSNIFDALLKSETEHPGSNGTGPANITEVLKRVERRASAQWKPKFAEQAANEKPNGHVVPGPAEEVHAARIATTLASSRVPEERSQTTAQVGVAVLDETLNSEFETIEPTLPASARLVAYMDKGSPGAEAFRLLAVRLRHIRKDRQLKKLLITSTVPQEGKSLTSANLACTLAAGGKQNVLLLEGDIRRPSLTELFHLSDRPGVCDWLQDKNRIEQCIYRVAGPEFCIMPCGRAAANPLDLIQSGKMAELLEQTQAMFDWVIIDSPPVLPLADTSILAKLADGVLLVARRGVTEKRHLERGLQALEKFKLLGAVMNSSRKSRHDDYYYSYSSRGAGQPPDLS
ncbi:MAG TPA: polysaccharide biosynthesis tyrosine autokinase [Acidobacteriaceae bacterium]|nr:polysaccharide biosynthesis tyrosine autokinase [Acidobacteriaceae bacterium]